MLLLIVTVLLFHLSTIRGAYQNSDESAIFSNSETTELEEKQKPKVAFTVNTDEELANLPDKDGYIDSVVSATKSIGVTNVVKSEIGNYEEISGIINLSAKCETENGNVLIITSMYITVSSKWSALSIVDYYTGNYYFVPEEQHDFVDLYDYKTGKIISRKTKDFEGYDAVEEFNKSIDEIDDKSGITK